MKRIVKYEAFDPFYSDVEQTYIGTSLDEIDRIQEETEEFMGRNHPNGIMSIYKPITIMEE